MYFFIVAETKVKSLNSVRTITIIQNYSYLCHKYSIVHWSIVNKIGQHKLLIF